MSISYIPENVKIRLWGKAAGCCQYENCSKPLFFDQLTKVEFNTSYIAHIYADQPNGPRGHETYSEALKSDISNLMLLCDEHHRLIDKAQIKEHPPERLIEMKKNHEERILLLSSLIPDKRSHIVLYGANIGEHGSPLNFKEAACAILPERYPANQLGISLGLKNSACDDRSPEYWRFQEGQLNQMFTQYISPLKGNHDVQHFSVFGLATMPLLIKLGTLFSDLYEVDVYQRHREPVTWQWQDETNPNSEYFKLVEPTNVSEIPVLNISLSATITNDRITSVLGENCSIWTIMHENPGNDFLRSKNLLQHFREKIRHSFNVIKAIHGQKSMLRIFPSMPISASIELGRVWMPKADMQMLIYDQNKEKNTFIKTITIK